MIKINFQMAGIDYKTEGETIHEALLKIPLSWEQIKAKALITVFNGKNSYDQIIYLRPLKRIFANKTAMLMLAKRLEILLNS